jgi:hypothetical protein
VLLQNVEAWFSVAQFVPGPHFLLPEEKVLVLIFVNVFVLNFLLLNLPVFLTLLGLY